MIQWISAFRSFSGRAQPLLTRMILLAAALWLAACGQRDFQAGDCAPGELNIAGVCRLVVGKSCARNPAICESGICLESERGAAAAYCSVNCMDDAACPAGYFCGSDSGGRAICVEGARGQRRRLQCRSDEDCGGCGVCFGGACRLPADCPKVGRCAADADCPRCSACEGGLCVRQEACFEQGCRDQYDCPRGRVCIADGMGGAECRLPDGRRGFGDPCKPDQPGECEGGLCVDMGAGPACTISCEADGDCPASFACKPAPGRSVKACQPGEAGQGAQCSGDSDCGDKEICAFVIRDDNMTAVCRLENSTLPRLGSVCAAARGCSTGACPASGKCSAPCGGDSFCPAGYLCEPVLFQLPRDKLAVFPGCVPTAEVRAGFGEPCPNGDGDCKSGGCFQTAGGGPRPFCSSGCDSDASCPDGYFCSQDARGRKFCDRRITTPACIGSSACGAGQACVFSTRGPVTFECGPARGSLAAGERCDPEAPDPPCESGLCLPSGVCTGPCGAGAGCPTGMICAPFEFNQGDGTFSSLAICQDDPGSLLPCQTSANCQKPEVCAVFLHPRSGEPQPRCANPNRNGGEAGASCRQPRDCANGVCLPQGRCAELCVDNRGCASPLECLNATLQLIEGMDTPIKVCGEKSAQARPGSPCSNGRADCPGLLCLNDGLNPPFCTRTCASDGDCSDGAPICRQLQSSARFCTPPNYVAP
ncbi:MAG: hypothetical protein GMKNLPBB_01975 [Myxococcota bacterium]|nr:hypothetical protein [Myxococcota bacterium]